MTESNSTTTHPTSSHSRRIGPIRPIPLSPAPHRKSVPSPNGKVVIIGAGLAGLSAAVRLLASGREVTVVERAGYVGGRAATRTLATDLGPIRVDTGATVLTMPELVDATLATAGLRFSDLAPTLQFRQLTPAYHALFASNRRIKVYSDADLMAGEIEAFATAKGLCPPDIVRGYRDLRRWTEDMYNAAFENFMSADFDGLVDTVSTPDSASDLLRVLRLGGMGSLERAVRRRLDDPELARLFSFQALYAGVSPARARAVYSVISHMDTTQGVFYPVNSAGSSSLSPAASEPTPPLPTSVLGTDGCATVTSAYHPAGSPTSPDHPARCAPTEDIPSGIGAVCDVLARAVRHLGGTILLNTEVTGAEIVDDRIVAVTIAEDSPTSTGCIPADAVVATCDLPVLEKITGRSYTRRLTWSPSAVVLHGAVPTEVASAWPGGHHTISFGKAWDETFHQLTHRHGGSLMRDPSLLVTRPATTAPDMRRTEGVEPVSILAPCPNLHSAQLDWPRLTAPYQRELLATLEQRGFAGITENFALGQVDTPATWAAQGLAAGTPFSAAHRFWQTGPLRTRNLGALGLNNLVLAGSTTTPGVGVPTAMLSGALAARRFTHGGVR